MTTEIRRQEFSKIKEAVATWGRLRQVLRSGEEGQLVPVVIPKDRRRFGWLMLLGIAISGGMFVVPLYAFLTTFVDKSQTARTVAANNIVNSGAMVGGSLLAFGLSAAGVAIITQLLLSAAMCLVSAWLGHLLVKAERAAAA